MNKWTETVPSLPVKFIIRYYLHRFLHVLACIFLDVVMRPYRMLQLVINDHAGTLRTGSADKQHDPCTGVGIRTLTTAHKVVDADCLIELQFNVPLDTKRVILKMVLPANLLAKIEISC